MCERKQTNVKDLFASKSKRYTVESENCDSRYGEFVQINATKKHSDLKSDTLYNQFNAIRCTTPNCSCDCFAPGKTQMRVCANCNHGWISHAIEKIGWEQLYNSHTVIETLQTNTTYDISSLILYGTHALPVRLKILLDRLLCTLDHDELLHLLHGFGWTYEDYSRGYMLQDYCGNVLSRWSIITKEEELIVLQLFLKIAETKNIAQNFVFQESPPIDQMISNSAIFNARNDSDFRKLIERTNKAVSSIMRHSSNYKLTNNSNNDIINTNCAVNMTSKTDSSVKTISSSSILQPISPTSKGLSPVNSHSPLSLSPLNKLQNMQPFDYRKSETNMKLPSMGCADIPMSYTQSTTPSSSPTTSTFSLMSSGQPLMTTAISTNHVSSISTNMTSTTNSDVSASDDSDDDTNMSGAINLSQTSSAYALKKVRHLRKSANPMKRRWNPMVLSGLTTNPSTGKKRVQCHVCLKTFCDKGALKIHFSAVHLREMHKCTVDGCNMMFSSRRSRNRHSANPNPKLHTPNFRRKVNPHDGRSANPYPLIAPTSSSSIINLSANSLVGQTDRQTISADNISMEFAQINSFSSSKTTFNEDVDRDGQRDGDMDNDKDVDTYSPNSSCQTGDNESLTSMPHTSNAIAFCDPISNKLHNKCKSQSPEEGMNLSLKDDKFDKFDITSNKAVRKRKSLNPTKCAPVAINTSDDDMRFITTDESSSDTYIERVDDDVQPVDDCKSDDYDSVDSNAFAHESKLTQNHNQLTQHKMEDNAHKQFLAYDIDGTIDLRKKRTPTHMSAEDKSTNRSDAAFVSQTAAKLTNESNMENPLRHLESLSLGSFTNLVSPRNHRGSMFLSNSSLSSHSLSYHAPGLGMCMKPSTPPSQLTSTAKSSERDDRENSSSKEFECANMSANSANAVQTSLMDSRVSDQISHVSLLPFRDASFVGSVEVPVDKENPRRCISCGKIFQNHFGVKTHYQNVHLKLMHKCTVDGCNASFPSKRSRDRHSANLNLHRKLLSTHSDNKSPFNLDKASASAMFPFHTGAALRDDLFSRLYDPQGLPLSLGDLYSRLPPLGADGLFAASAAAAAAAASFPVVPGFHPAMCLPPPPPPMPSSSLYLDNRSCLSRESPNSMRTTPSPSLSNRSSPPKALRTSSPSTDFVFEATIIADENGKYVCIYCHHSKSDASALRQHYERVHRDLLYRCCIRGCNKVFLDKKTKKRHIHLHSSANKDDNP